MAERSQFSEAVCRRVLEGIALGATQQDAALYAGITPHALQSWVGDARKLADEQPDHPKVLFAEQLREARNNVKLESITLVRNAARDRISASGQTIRGDWKAAAWMLERRYPSEFGIRKEGVNPDRAASLLGVLLERVLADTRMALTLEQRQMIPVVLHEHIEHMEADALALEPSG